MDRPVCGSKKTIVTRARESTVSPSWISESMVAERWPTRESQDHASYASGRNTIGWR